MAPLSTGRVPMNRDSVRADNTDWADATSPRHVPTPGIEIV